MDAWGLSVVCLHLTLRGFCRGCFVCFVFFVTTQVSQSSTSFARFILTFLFLSMFCFFGGWKGLKILLARVYSEEQPGDAATALFIKQLSEEDAGQYR